MAMLDVVCTKGSDSHVVLSVPEDVAKRCGLFRELLEGRMQEQEPQAAPLPLSAEAVALWLEGPNRYLLFDAADLLPAVQVAEFVADDAMPKWVAAFWSLSIHCRRLAPEATELMLQQQHDLKHRLAQLHPQVKDCTHVIQAAVVRDVPHPLVLAYACAHRRQIAQDCHSEPSWRFFSESEDDGLEVKLADTPTCRKVIEACQLLRELHNVPVKVEVDILGQSKLAPQLGTVRRFARAASGKRAAELPALVITFVGNIPSARCAPIACKRAARILNTADASHLRRLEFRGPCIGDVGLAQLVPSILRLTALTALDLSQTGLGPAAACLLAGVLPTLQRLQNLSLNGMHLPFWPDAKRAEGALGMALGQIPELVRCQQ